MKAIMLEGSPEEIRAALGEFIDAPSKSNIQAVTLETDAKDDSEEWVISYESALLVLQRAPLNTSHRTLFQTLANAHPEKVSANKLMEIMNKSSAQFRGFMGAFGKRVNHTEGASGYWFFDQVWDHSLLCNQYGLHKSSLKALQELEII